MALSHLKTSQAVVVLVAAVGGGLTIYLLAAVQAWTHLMVLAPPFGASCVLVFALPDSPLAQPRNVVGGHLTSTAAGLLVLAAMGHGPLAQGVGVGAAIGAMMLTRTLHPPAGGDPLLVMLSAAPVSYLVTPMLIGTVGIVVVGALYHRLVSRKAYAALPPRWPMGLGRRRRLEAE